MKTPRDRARVALLAFDDYPNLKEVWIENCRKVKNQDCYDLILRTEGDLHMEDVSVIEKAFGVLAGPLSSGSEEDGGCGCGYCGGVSSFLEVSLESAKIPL